MYDPHLVCVEVSDIPVIRVIRVISVIRVIKGLWVTYLNKH